MWPHCASRWLHRSSVSWPCPYFSPGLDWLPVQVTLRIFTNQQGMSTNQSEQMLQYLLLDNEDLGGAPGKPR